MTEPGTDRVGRDPPRGERRHAGRTALDKPIDPEPRIGLSVPAEEDGIVGCPSLHEPREHGFGARPQRTLAVFSAVAVDVDERVPPAECLTGTFMFGTHTRAVLKRRQAMDLGSG